ncbi:CapA family protein [Streptomyces pinistramenti]|uniref:CapA family protein n=1 Tax=Streptomyces pinistramenti TaxID=2884812 RepID=UPI001D07A181|nr:CapA family protein [Streptomyces pinistramenti]MCB5910229.1 CapA family protein [Streptomyces pinistramenti]
MSAYTRYAAAVLLAGLAVGCAAGPEAPQPPPSLRATPGGHAGAPAPAERAEPPGPAEPDKQPFTLVASGDVLASYATVLSTAQQDASGTGYDYRPMLKGIKPVISSADLALCQLATPLGPLEGPFASGRDFLAPPQVATALKDAGFDSCATASAHSLDRGAEGVGRTLEALDTVGLRHAGTARNVAEASRPALLTAGGGARVAQLSYTLGVQGGGRAAAAPWAVNLADEQRIIADARAARRAGADLVVVSAHWGTEYRTEPDPQQTELARVLTASETDGRPDIDLIVGSRARTPQPYEKVNGTWVVYGLGNQIAGTMKKPQGDWGTIARFHFAPPEQDGERWQVTRAEYVPQLITREEPLRTVDLGRTSGHAKERKAITAAVLSRDAAAEGLKQGK